MNPMRDTSSNTMITIRELAQRHLSQAMRVGDVIFRSGESGDYLYGIVSGSVMISWNGEDSEADDAPSRSETMSAGAVFGIGALVDPAHRRHGTATALSDGELLVMNREEFLLAVQELPVFALDMLQDLELRLQALKEAP